MINEKSTVIAMVRNKVFQLNFQVEISLSPVYPFLYYFRKGGRNGRIQETFYA